jgi:hypothetical protein
MIRAHFFTSHKASEKVCLPSQMSHPQGLATLSMVLAPFHPRKPLSAPNAPGLFPSEPFSNRVVAMKVSLLASALALQLKTSSAFKWRFDGLTHVVSRIPDRPQMFSPGRDPCSLGLSTSRALPPRQSDLKYLSLNLPSRLFSFNDLTITEVRDLRVFTPE